MIGAFLLVKATSPIMNRLPRRTQDAIVRSVAKTHLAYVDSHLRPAAVLVSQNVDRLDDADLTELRSVLDREDWDRRLLCATGAGQADVAAWMAANPNPRDTNYRAATASDPRD